MTTIDTTPEAIAALLDGVTPGPWGADNGEGYSANAVKALRPFIKYPATVAHAVGDSAEAEANMRFIAASRELVPALAAEIARLTAERDEARAQVAMAFEVAAKMQVRNTFVDQVTHDVPKMVQAAIRVLTPADASTALAARDAAMRNEGRRQAAGIAWLAGGGEDTERAIIAALEPEGGE